MIMTRMLTGGAIIPSTAPEATKAAARAGLRPSLIRTGAISGPVLKTAASEEPVIMPGSISKAVTIQSRATGRPWKVRRMAAVSPSSRPEAWSDFMKTMAVAMIRMMSKKPKAPSTR